MRDALTERLDAAVTAGDVIVIRDLLGQLDAAVKDPGHMLEVADLLFDAGMRDLAGRWAERIAAAGRPLTAMGRRHHLWLRANIAWQQGDFQNAKLRMDDCHREVGPEHPCNALSHAAAALVSLSGARTPAECVDARQHAEAAIAVEGCPIQARFAAAAALAILDARAPQLVLLDAAEDIDDPEGLAYRDAARELLLRCCGHVLPRRPARAVSKAQRRAYVCAVRYARPVVDCVAGCFLKDEEPPPRWLREVIEAAARGEMMSVTDSEAFVLDWLDGQ